MMMSTSSSGKTIPFLLSLLLLLALMGCDDRSSSTEVLEKKSMSSSEMQRALFEALATEDMIERMVVLGVALQSLDESNVDGAAQAVMESSPEALRVQSMVPLAYKWASIDPVAFFDFARVELPRGQVRGEALRTAIGRWVPDGGSDQLLQYIETLQEQGAEEAKPMRSMFLQSLLFNDYLDEATPLIAAMPDDEQRHLMLLRIVVEKIKVNPDGLIAWVNSIPVDAPNNLKPKVFSQAVKIMALNYPEKAAQWYEEDGYEDWVLNDAMPLIATEWGKEDPEAAFEWMFSQPPSDTRDTAIRGVVYRWQKASPETSEPWLRARLSDPAMAPALYPFAQWLLYQDPVEAIAWGTRIPDQREREYVITQSFGLWLQKDDAAALEWLETADLSPGLRRDIKQMVSMPVKRKFKNVDASETDGAVADEKS